MKAALLVFGFLAIAMGLVWIGQGTGYFPYPKSSIMINQAVWAVRGGILLVIGIVVVVVSRRF